MIIAYLLLDIWLFFLLYIASMGAIEAYKMKRLNSVLWVLCLPIVIIGYVLDVIHNLTVFTMLYFEFPKELTVTERLKRHAKDKTFRGKLSIWIAETLLNPFDHTGNHID